MKIRFEHVQKKFGEKTVLRDISWTIADGEKWQVRGSSGIGKTTLLRLLMGLETPDDGQIVGADDVLISAVFQEDRLLENLNAVQNVRFACNREISDDCIINALEALLPPTSLYQPVRTLSGGMRRRVAMVRALLPPSQLVLLDEPFSGLDRETITQTESFLEQHAAEKAVVLVSHEVCDAFCDALTLKIDADGRAQAEHTNNVSGAE